MDQADSLTIGMVMFPGMTQLDFTGPYEIFARMPGARVLLLAADLQPVATQYGLTLASRTMTPSPEGEGRGEGDFQLR